MACMLKSRKLAFLGALLMSSLCFAGPAMGSFFQIAENCPAGLGNAFAGGGAAAEDPCTVWFNPAGMTRLEGTQAVFGGHFILPSLDFEGSASTFLGLPISGGDGGDAGDEALVPNLYITHQVNDRIVIGLGLNAPFGLTTDYEDDWVGRYYADLSEIITVNVNPSIAFKLNEKFSLGLGVNYQTIDAELSQAVDFGSTCFASEFGGLLPPGTCAAFGQVPRGSDGKGVVDADDDAFGFNLGLLIEPSETFRIGISYRSEMSYDLEGDFTVTTANPGTAAFANLIGITDTAARASVDLPETISVSFFWQSSEHWAWMADYSQTGWSSLPELRILFDNGAPDTVTTLELDDSDRFAIGATFTPNERYALRFGVASDETPVPSPELRTPRLPDEDRTWYTVGFDYNRSERLSLSLSYGLIDIDEAEIRKTTGLPGSEDFLRGNLTGVYDFGVNIISAQLTWRW